MTFDLDLCPQRGGDLPGMNLVERLSVLISGGSKKEVCFVHISMFNVEKRKHVDYSSHDYILLWEQSIKT